MTMLVLVQAKILLVSSKAVTVIFLLPAIIKILIFGASGVRKNCKVFVKPTPDISNNILVVFKGIFFILKLFLGKSTPTTI